MASIREVAKLAGVSPATVSRVLNKTARVDADKEERVRKAIEQTGFVPNAVARSLFKKSAKTIGLIVPNIENPFFTHMANYIEKEADERGYRLLLCNSDNQVEKEREMIQMLTSMNADGIIITTSNKEVRPYINECSIPIVITDRTLERAMKCDYVHCDHYEGGRIAAEHLIDCGCKKIVCMRAGQDISSAKLRYEGYRDVCKERGIEERVVECDYDFSAGLSATVEILSRYPNTDGIIACNDMVALSVYKELHKRDIDVPGQIQIVGFDNIELSRLLTPELTTVAQPIEELGRMAARLIIESDRDSEKKEYMFKPSLIQRETTMIK